ncbi:FixH family protein [Cohnella sp. GCM10027633]|uniref:FixH family protein n=1 Tax=unclassified Cohnella TaxID=2636738 RepID=UPI003634E131
MKLRNPIIRNVVVFSLTVALLTGCTMNTEGTDEHGFEPHLTVDLQVPAPAAADDEVSLSVEVKKSGQPVSKAEQAEFVVWPNNEPDQAISVVASERSPGVYSAHYSFGAEGLYIVQSRISAGGLAVMPAKRIAIGDDAVTKLAILEEGDSSESPSGTHH